MSKHVLNTRLVGAVEENCECASSKSVLEELVDRKMTVQCIGDPSLSGCDLDSALPSRIVFAGG